jgi:hypothetical protein
LTVGTRISDFQDREPSQGLKNPKQLQSLETAAAILIAKRTANPEPPVPIPAGPDPQPSENK